MSIESVLGRIAELTVVTAPAPVAAPSQQTATATQAPATTFAATLAQATAPPVPTTALPAATTSEPYGDEIAAAAAQNGVDPNLVRAVIKQESGFDPNATSAAGAQGLMQLMPGTASGLGVTNPLDPAQSIAGGTRYLRQQLDRFGGDVSLALAAYNAGPGAVERFGGIPPYAQTQDYVRSVLANFQAFSSQPTTTERGPL